MNEFKKLSFKQTAASMIQNLSLRGMDGYYFENIEDVHTRIQTLIPNGSSVSWGGSITLQECGIIDLLKKGNYECLDRANAKSPEEQRALYGKIATCDYFFTSTNAITLNGELVNIDGIGNRVSCLIHGPQNVIVVVGMNKIVPSIETGILRAQNIAAPPNAQRLNRNTPCYKTGKCENCYSADSMCSQIVITRRSSIYGRIKVLLIADNLGF